MENPQQKKFKTLRLPKTDELIENLLEGNEEEDIEVISNEVIDNTRWSIVKELLVRIKDKFYRTHYFRGATEYQDEGPWEHENEIVLTEVQQRAVIRMVYEEVEEE
jgi:hypothetical protein